MATAAAKTATQHPLRPSGRGATKGAMQYEKLSMEELQAEFVLLAGKLVVIENARAEILKIMEFRRSQVAARARLSVMSKTEKDALREALKS